MIAHNDSKHIYMIPNTHHVHISSHGDINKTNRKTLDNRETQTTRRMYRMQIRQCFKLNANKSKKLEPYVTRTEINAKCNETFTQLFDDMNVYPGYVLKDFCGMYTLERPEWSATTNSSLRYWIFQMVIDRKLQWLSIISTIRSHLNQNEDILRMRRILTMWCPCLIIQLRQT